MDEDDNSALDAVLDRAFDTAFADKAEEVAPVETTEEVSEGPARGPDGKFIAKEAAEPTSEPVEAVLAPEAPVAAPEEAPAPVAAVEAPTDWRLSKDAVAAWKDVPPAVQADVARRFSEMERGINEYRAKFEPLRQFSEMAEAQGTTLADAMQRYVGIEQELAQNPIQGLERICQNLGYTLKDVAAHVLGQPQQPVDAQVQTLTGQMRQMQAELEVFRAQERKRQEEVYNKSLETVNKFAAERPRFAELQGQITWLLKTQGASTLEEAYELAERLKPAPTAAPAAPAATAAPSAPKATQPEVRPLKKAGISIDGAPGSNPTTRPKARNADEAVDRSFDQLGL